MKKTIILFTIILYSFTSQAWIDTVSWNKLVTPHTFYTYGDLNQVHLIKYISQTFLNNSDTLVIDLVFTECNAPASAYTWDSLISINSSIIKPNFCLLVRGIIDSNTILPNCKFTITRYIDTLFFDCNAPLSISQSTFNNTLTLSPNPVQNILTLQSQEPMEQVSIYNMYGVLVQKQTYSEHINVAALRSGVYVLEARGKHGVWRSKFQKE